MFKKEQLLHQNKIDFFTNITHEIRTHLTLILSPVDKIIDERNNDMTLQKQLHNIKRTAGNLLELSEELMDFRKAETGNLELHIDKHDIVPLLKEIHGQFSDLAISRKMKFSLNHEVQSCYLFFDALQLKKVFTNLIINAFKFTPDNGCIKINIKEKPHCLIVSITDNGKGIDSQYADKLFNNYFQINDKGTLNKGYGIGLALSQNIARLHNAKIEFECNKSDHPTTTFSVVLDKEFGIGLNIENKAKLKTLEEKQQSKSLQTIHNAPPKDVRQNLHKATVLVVDDNAEILHILSEILGQEYNVFLRENVMQGLEYAVENLPDIIISDVMMPDEDGFSFCNRLKTDLRTCHIPVILLTAKNTQQDHIEGLLKGADIYLNKPFNRKILELTVKNLLITSERIRENVRLRLESDSVVFNETIQIHDTESSSLTELDNVFLNEVLQIIDVNMDDPTFNISVLAKKIGMSKPILYKKMRAITNLTLNDFIKSIKLKKAAELLQTTKMSVNDICYAVGFQDKQYFSSEFKRKFGKTPKDFLHDKHFDLTD